MSDLVIDFDPAKDAINRAKHGCSLADAGNMDWSTVRVVPDSRQDYREPRFQLYGRLNNRLHVLVVTPRDGGLRAISLRRANRREVMRYG